MVESHRQEHIAAGRIHERAREYRGRFLTHVAVIERDIAAILTSYFCTEDPSKQELFFSRVAGRMSLDEKRVLLTEIVKRDYPRTGMSMLNFYKISSSCRAFETNSHILSLMYLRQHSLARSN